MDKVILNLSDLVKASIKSQNLKQKEAADRAKVTPQAVSDIINGRWEVGQARLNRMLIAVGYETAEIIITEENGKPGIDIKIR